jgi:hypothetical protein
MDKVGEEERLKRGMQLKIEFLIWISFSIKLGKKD